MLRASNDRSGDDQPAHAEALEAFATAVADGHDDLPAKRAELADAVGLDLLAEAAAVTAAFHGYVRVADGTGIPVDELVVATSAGLRAELGIDDYPGGANSVLGVESRPAGDFNPGLDDLA